MSLKGKRRRLGREKLQRIIEMCNSLEERSLDPFLLDIDEVIGVIKEYFPDWELPEDLCLDAETIHRLASVITLQSEWIKQRSTSLYTDPFILEEKLTLIDKKDIIDIFAKTWHPIVEFEQISLHSLAEAIKYWENLLPLDERWKDFSAEKVEADSATRRELIRQRILGDREFSDELECFWQRLRSEVKEKGVNGKIEYWNFIGAETYEATIHKAFMTSFLVTYGYATLEIYPLEEEIFIKPHQKPSTKIRNRPLVSIPIAITVEDWMKWNRRELNE